MGANASLEAQAIRKGFDALTRPPGQRRPTEKWQHVDKMSLEISMNRTDSRQDKLRKRQFSDRAMALPASSRMDLSAPEPEPFEEISSGYATDRPQNQSEYQPLTLVEPPLDEQVVVEEDEFGKPLDPDSMPHGTCRGNCSAKMLEWHESWLHAVECGELDIYTCLGVSNVPEMGEDTRRLMGKVFGVLVLQLLVPIILLRIELEAGFSFQPRMSGTGFRIMGVCLYLYSLYSMYNNALDECRSSLLQWCIDQSVPSGFWLPMMLGEILNVFVSLILVVSLFVIFVETEHPADLILNAVAVNFLGAVDGEMVNDVMTEDALKNFKLLFYEYGCDGEKQGEKKHSMLHTGLNFMLTVIVLSGLLLSMVFLFAPSPTPTLEETVHMEPTGYPKLI